ncbi:type III secretion system protein [Burkholderia sp. ABCPW 14]|uniref:type III secretion system inner membrane ring lipoprotein SctJ n=1 Tax=Burkholderia sp. ABCPW 14 TaxID=1637860 RepID=UPI000770CD3D|nr:type III secretion inner membrane ring lipoprotein SctJ [Burkholderia sp. ABCPW 14]KVD78003.1 type III secretion system protein [Burkholderia sp. ABCPW 14]
MKRLASLTLLPAVLLLSACHQQQLLHNLSEQQANEVVAVLQAHDLSIDKQDLGKSGFTVSVGQADFPAAVDLLQQYNLPSRARVEVAEAFPADALVASPQAEEARLLSAVEQRLEQNLAAMNNVVSARVQVSYPLQQETVGKGEPPMHVAVLLTYRNDVNHDVLVSEVKRFVKNSFANIDYDNVSVLLYQAPSVFRTMATEPSASGRTTWLYWLLAIPAFLAVSATGALVFVRRRRQARLARAKDVEAQTADDGGDAAADEHSGERVEPALDESEESA